MESDKVTKSLIPAALERIRYLAKVVNTEILNEGVQGDEEALWGIYKFLHSNGWWEKAKNLKLNPDKGRQDSIKSDTLLLDFIQTNRHLVDKNVQQLVREGNTEGIRMALNQIHYGSLKQAGEWKEKQGNKKNKTRVTGDRNNNRICYVDWNQLLSQLKIVQDFLQGFKSLIEPSVFWDAMRGDDKALSLALGQIHHHSLPVNNIYEKKSLSFKEALLTNPTFNSNHSCNQSTTSRESAPPKKHKLSVFFTNFDENLNMKDLWSLFKKVGRFRDIILPRKRGQEWEAFWVCCCN